jgi:phosphoserine phosphatase
MKELFLIRHGETDWNRNEVFRGRIDIPLNAMGHLQAAALSRAMETRSIRKVYSSPLGRARETAGGIARFHGLDVMLDEGFIDFNYGEWEGMSLHDVRQRHRDLCHQWTEAPHTVSIPGGESLAAVRRRIRRVMAKILEDDKEECIAIVSHRVICKVMICAVLSLSNAHFWQFRQDTACMNHFQFSSTLEQGVVVTLNDTSHLQGIQESCLGGDF